MYEVCENCEEVFDPSSGAGCSCGVASDVVGAVSDPGSDDWLGTAKELMGAQDNEFTVGVDTPIEVMGHGELDASDEPHKACDGGGECDPDVNKANRGDESCGTVGDTTVDDVVKKLDAVFSGPANESIGFDKFMDDLLLKEGVHKNKARAMGGDSPQRIRAARHQERPLGRIVYGAKK